MSTAIEELPESADEGAGRPGKARQLAGFMLRRPGLTISALLVLAVLIAAVDPGLFTGQDPIVGNTGDILLPPSAAHIFGTDYLGRDMFSRVVYGARASVEATALAVLVALVVGGLLGLLAGAVGGWLDLAIMRLVDFLMAIPSLLLALALISALGYGTVKVAIAVGVAGVASFARVMRSEVLRVRTSDYVEASRNLGARWHRVLAWHLLPNARGPVTVLATLEFGVAILSVSSLSFLGYGAPPPAPEWGELLADGQQYMAVAWWLITLPGLVVALTILAINRIARGFDEWGAER